MLFRSPWDATGRVVVGAGCSHQRTQLLEIGALGGTAEQDGARRDRPVVRPEPCLGRRLLLSAEDSRDFFLDVLKENEVCAFCSKVSMGGCVGKTETHIQILGLEQETPWLQRLRLCPRQESGLRGWTWCALNRSVYSMCFSMQCWGFLFSTPRTCA